jgi:perosamine synthetase
LDKLAIHGGKPVRPAKKAANPRYSAAARSTVMDHLERGDLSEIFGGPRVIEFERAFAEWFGMEHAVACNSGTSALHIGYLAAGIEEMSEVLVPANAYISALSALIQCELVPVVVDIDPRSWVMDPVDAERKLSPRTRGIVPVHMYGQPCPMGEIQAIADRHDLVVVEDCGQSHGASWNGRLLGTLSHVSCFSLCCRKHVNCGWGGIILTNSQEAAAHARARVNRGKGADHWFDYRMMGFSYNLTEIQAILALDSLRDLAAEFERRQRFAAYLREALRPLGLVFPEVPAGSTHAYFKFNFLLPPELGAQRNGIVDALRAENIGADPCHPHVLWIDWLREQRPSFFARCPRTRRPDYDPETCPHAEDILARQVGLELGPGLDLVDMELSAEAVHKVVTWYRSSAGKGR